MRRALLVLRMVCMGLPTLLFCALADFSAWSDYDTLLVSWLSVLQCMFVCMHMNWIKEAVAFRRRDKVRVEFDAVCIQV
jgi:hypothetical protein